ncbi:MAG: molecular chaperone [Nitrospinota bacterium]
MQKGLLREPASGRCRAYRDLAALFRYPGGDLTFLAREDVLRRDFLAWSEEAGGRASASAAGLAGELADRLGGLSIENLQSEFAGTFGHAVSEDCPPYETHFGCAHVYQQTERMADIAGCYRAFGLEVADEAGERPDHIALELEFMHFLVFKEQYAREQHGEDKATLCREAQRTFMENHLGRWAPYFFRQLAQKAAGAVYEKAAELGLVFLETEAKVLGVCPQEDVQEVSAAVDAGDSCTPCLDAEFCGGLEGRF